MSCLCLQILGVKSLSTAPHLIYSGYPMLFCQRRYFLKVTVHIISACAFLLPAKTSDVQTELRQLWRKCTPNFPAPVTGRRWMLSGARLLELYHPFKPICSFESTVATISTLKGLWELNGQTHERCLEWDWHPVNSQSMLVISIKTLICFLMVCFLFIDLYQIGQEERINSLLGAHIG